MKPEIVVKASKLLDEIKELSKYKDFLKYNKDTVHFEILKNYMFDPPSSCKITIDTSYNERFFKLVEEIISELEAELDSL